MTISGKTASGRLLPLLAGGFLMAIWTVAVPFSGLSAYATQAPDVSAGVSADDPAQRELNRKREETRAEIDALKLTMGVSAEKTQALRQNIASIEKNTQSIREALIQSAGRRKMLEASILEHEKKIAGLGIEESAIRKSLYERRHVLAEVLAALQRMGRNPPPALLVTPDDALGSVRSAILLGAVVPGIRGETEKLMADLKGLTTVHLSMQAERDTMSSSIGQALEEERRIDLLLAENDKLNRQTSADLAAEQRRVEELAGKATSLEGLIVSIERDISTIRTAQEMLRAEEERQKQLSQEEREKARSLADSGVPDKNRIAPAYAFASLRQKLDLPVAGDILRSFGDQDGTGHQSKGMTLAASPNGTVTAPADGLVVFAGAFRSYGQMIILDTGDGYHVVMTGMDKINTRQGKFVFSGEPVAVMGEKRVASAAALALETDRPTLYIEFRKDGAPVDSRPWWASKVTGRARNDS